MVCLRLHQERRSGTVQRSHTASPQPTGRSANRASPMAPHYRLPGPPIGQFCLPYRVVGKTCGTCVGIRLPPPVPAVTAPTVRPDDAGILPQLSVLPSEISTNSQGSDKPTPAAARLVRPAWKDGVIAVDRPRRPVAESRSGSWRPGRGRTRPRFVLRVARRSVCRRPARCRRPGSGPGSAAAGR